MGTQEPARDQEEMKPLDPKNYVVTLNDKTREPLMSGMCVLDRLKGQPDFLTRVWLTFSKPLQ